MQGLREKGYMWNSLSPLYATRKGHLHALQWLVKHDCPWDENDCFQMSIIYGHLEILEWIRKTKEFYQFIWESLINAVCNGRIEIFRYLLNESTTEGFCEPDELNEIEYQMVVSTAVTMGQSEMTSLLIENASIWQKLDVFRQSDLNFDVDFDGVEETDRSARIKRLRMQVLQKTWKGDSLLSSERYEKASKTGSVKVLRWLKSKKVTMSDSRKEKLVLNAIRNGHVQVLEWMKKQEFSFAPETCEWAVTYDKLPVLKWLVENGCKWDAKNCLKEALKAAFDKTHNCLAENCRECNVKNCLQQVLKVAASDETHDCYYSFDNAESNSFNEMEITYTGASSYCSNCTDDDDSGSSFSAATETVIDWILKKSGLQRDFITWGEVMNQIPSDEEEEI